MNKLREFVSYNPTILHVKIYPSFDHKPCEEIELDGKKRALPTRGVGTSHRSPRGAGAKSIARAVLYFRKLSGQHGCFTCNDLDSVVQSPSLRRRLSGEV